MGIEATFSSLPHVNLKALIGSAITENKENISNDEIIQRLERIKQCDLFKIVVIKDKSDKEFFNKMINNEIDILKNSKNRNFSK